MDLEMAGLLMLWLMMEEVCPKLRAAHVALFSDNSPTIGWVKRLAERGSLVHHGRGESMHPNSVSPCLARRYKIIISQGGHYKFGFGNGRITNAMASDGENHSEIMSSPCYAVQ